jgi:hypothetical protein
MDPSLPIIKWVGRKIGMARSISFLLQQKDKGVFTVQEY